MTFPFHELLENVVWQALTTEHASLAVSSPLARRYPADVVPISALREHRAEAVDELRELMQPGEATHVMWSEAAGDLPACAGLEVLSDLNALQMIYPGGAGISGTQHGDASSIERLMAAHSAEMVALTDLAFPGFFRPRTYVMGRYWGIRSEGRLVSMAGERLALPGLREVSAVCTHPEYRGRGYAGHLIRHVLAVHRGDGLHSFLHVGDTNRPAIALYESLGFARAGVTRYASIRRALTAA